MKAVAEGHPAPATRKRVWLPHSSCKTRRPLHKWEEGSPQQAPRCGHPSSRVGAETPEEAYACRMASMTQRDNRNLDRALPRIQEWKVTNSWSVLLIGSIRLTYATKAHTGQPGTEPPPGPSPECELSEAQRGQVEFGQGLRQEHRTGPEDHRFPIQQLPAAIPTEHGVHKKAVFLSSYLTNRWNNQ